MRGTYVGVTTAFNRILGLPGASVESVAFTDEGLVIGLRRRGRRRLACWLLHCSWEVVDHIVARVVTEHLDDSRLDELYRIGVDEISHKRGHRYLTVVADHDTAT